MNAEQMQALAARLRGYAAEKHMNPDVDWRGDLERAADLIEQMPEYGRACERAAYERAIVAAEHNASLYPEGSTGWESSVECAQAIRTIKNLSELGKRT